MSYDEQHLGNVVARTTGCASGTGVGPHALRYERNQVVERLPQGAGEEGHAVVETNVLQQREERKEDDDVVCCNAMRTQTL